MLPAAAGAVNNDCRGFSLTEKSSHAPENAMKKSDSTTAASTPLRREAMGGLAKGLEVIRAFTHDSPSLTLSEIAGRAGLPAATARRCLLTLAECGYVMQSGGRCWPA
jgi:Fic family protein